MWSIRALWLFVYIRIVYLFYLCLMTSYLRRWSSQGIYLGIYWLYLADLTAVYVIIVIGFSILLLLWFKHITNNSSEPNFHSKLEDKISPFSTLSAMLETHYLLSLSESYVPWKCCSSFSVFLLFLFLTNFRFIFSIRAFNSMLFFPYKFKILFFFCLSLLTITRRSLYLSMEWLYFSCRIQYFWRLFVIFIWSLKILWADDNSFSSIITLLQYPTY